MKLNQELRPYQLEAARLANQHIECFDPDSPDTSPRLLIASPTATGKGTMALDVLLEQKSRGRNGLILAPTRDIVRGFLERLGYSTKDLETETTAPLGIATPVAYLNRLCDGRLDAPDFLIIDECHEWIPDNTICGQFEAALGYLPWVGFTATPFRGTQKGTLELQQFWGPPQAVLTYRDAVDTGYISWPDFEQRLLIDDDEIRIVNGEFSGSETDAYIAQFDRSREIAKLVLDKHTEGRSIVVSLPGSAAIKQVQTQLAKLGLFSSPITQSTTRKQRELAYSLSRDYSKRRPILQVATIYRGTDLPWLDTLIDAQPTKSPVRFLQTAGRIMRPNKPSTSKAPLYVCTNRNLERNAHLLVGVMPVKELVALTQELPSRSKRGAAGWLGFEDLSRRKLYRVSTRHGYQVQFGCWRKTCPATGVISERAAVVLPLHGACLTFQRSLTPDPEARSSYPYVSSKWRQADAMPAKGWVSLQARETTPSQQRFWGRSASGIGLDPDQTPTKSPPISLLQLAFDTGLRFNAL